MDPALLACATGVHPATMAAVVRVESGGNPLALNVNRWRGPQPRPATVTEAAATARRFIADGFTVDMGAAQVNDRNLHALGYTIEQIFDPCTNIRAGGRILSEGYARGVAVHGEGQSALLAALSAYNTGSLTRGFGNGYVARYLDGRPVSMPAPADAPRATNALARSSRTAKAPSPLTPYAADTAVFVRETSYAPRVD